MQIYLAAAYWNARETTVDDCVARTSHFLARLESVSEAFSGWRDLGWSEAEALANKVITPQSLLDLRERFQKGRNRRETDHTVIEDLGYRVSFWNGRSGAEGATLRIHCGDYATGLNFRNGVILRPLRTFDASSKENVSALAYAFIESWEPDFFILTRDSRLSSEHEQAQARNVQWMPFLDIALYLDENLPTSLAPERYSSRDRLKAGFLFLNS